MTPCEPAYGLWKRVAVCLIVFAVVWMGYKNVRVLDRMTYYDNFWYVPTATSLLEEGNFDLTEWQERIHSLDPGRKTLRQLNIDEDVRIDHVGDKRINVYNPATSVVIVPFVAWYNYRFAHIEHPLERALAMNPRIAKTFAAASVACLAWILLSLGSRIGPMLILTALFAFATPHASNHAGGLWSHNTGGFFLLVGFALLLRSGRWRAGLGALALALAFTMRNDYIVFLAAATGFVWFVRKSDRWAWLGAGALAALLFFAYYFGIYGTLFHATHRAGWGDGGLAQFPVRLAGLWVSPNRGLFVFTPLFLFSFGGLFYFWKQRRGAPLLAWFGGALLAHSLFLSGWPIWWGGWSYGPRFFAGVSGFWILALWPLVRELKMVSRSTLLFGVAAVCSFGVHAVGMFSPAVHDWNAEPVDVDDAIERVWDASDWMPMRIFAQPEGVKGTP